MAVTNINLENFDQQVTNAASPVLVDFWAAWCGPCSMLSPVVEELAQEHPEIAFGKVNVDEAPELAQKYFRSPPFPPSSLPGRQACGHVCKGQVQEGAGSLPEVIPHPSTFL